MTYTVSRAALLASGVSNIEFQVTQYAKNLKQWIDHHRKVEAEKSTPLRPEPQRVDFKSDEEFSEAFNHWTEEKINRHQPYPADVIHPDLMKCVRVGDGDEVTEDYTITEDLPTPEDVLRQKKNLLMSKVYDAEAKQVAALVLPGKQNIPLWLTIVLGIVGAGVGTLIVRGTSFEDTGGIDWVKHILQVVIAAVLIWAVTAIMGRTKRPASSA